MGLAIAARTMKRMSRRGLSLIEIIVVITITAMLMSAVGVYALGVQRSSQLRTAKMDVRNAAGALDLYRAQQGRYPDPREGFAPVIALRALKAEPLDPWGTPLIWALKDGEPVVSSLGPDRAVGGAGDDADITSAD